MKQGIIFFYALFIFSGSLAAQANISVPSKHFYLVFSARPATIKPFSLGGHAFVSWGDGDSNIICAQRTLGFYPNKKINLYTAIFKRKPGRVEKGFRTNARGVRLTQMVVELDSSTWNETLLTSVAWDGAGYNLWDKNCTSYVDYIAKRAALKTPRRLALFLFPRGPVKYIEKMWKKNKRRSTKPTRLIIEDVGTDFDAVILGPDDFLLEGAPVNQLSEKQKETRVRVEAGFFDINFARNFEH